MLPELWMREPIGSRERHSGRARRQVPGRKCRRNPRVIESALQRTEPETAMPRVVHFEIHAAEPERAIRFYHELFGWQFNKWAGPEDYWLVVTGPKEEPGIDGGMVRRRG